MLFRLATLNFCCLLRFHNVVNLVKILQNVFQFKPLTFGDVMKIRLASVTMIFLMFLGLQLTASTVNASEFSANTMKRMSIFLSNFTELGMFDFDAKDILNENKPRRLIRFGIWHNYVNNFDSKIRQSGNKLSIDGSFVRETIRKYFDYNIKRLVSVGRFTYNGRKYIFDGADGEAVYYARVTNAKTISRNLIEMKGYLYNADDKNDRYGKFVALAKPHKYNGKNTWSIIRLSHRK